MFPETILSAGINKEATPTFHTSKTIHLSPNSSCPLKPASLSRLVNLIQEHKIMFRSTFLKFLVRAERLKCHCLHKEAQLFGILALVSLGFFQKLPNHQPHKMQNKGWDRNGAAKLLSKLPKNA